MNLRWMWTNGGPLMLLEERLLRAWHGDGGEGADVWRRTPAPAAPPRRPDDYDRACTVNDYVGVIPVGDGQGLVFGAEQYDTAWWPVEGDNNCAGVFVRWSAARSEDDLIGHLRRLPRPGGDHGGVSFRICGAALWFFEAGFPGDEARAEGSKIEIPVGDYEVGTEWYQPESHTALLLHRFIKRGNVVSSRPRFRSRLILPA